MTLNEHNIFEITSAFKQSPWKKEHLKTLKRQKKNENNFVHGINWKTTKKI